jgi:SNF2 family DNA or RNA helicase
MNEHTIAVRHGLEETKILRNLGYDVPAPILSRYDWPRQAKYPKVYEHQKETAAFCTLHNRCFVLNDMATMKTLSTLWAADFLMTEGLIRRALILCTMTCMDQVWTNEIWNNLMHRTSIVVHNPQRQKRLLTLKENVDFYILNHDGLKVKGVVDAIEERGDIDLIMVDEASALRNSRTDTYWYMKKMLKPHHKLWMITGQPCPNGPVDAFGLGQLVSPHLLPKYITRWEAETMTRINEFKSVPKPGAMKRVYEVLQPAIRYRREDCIELPPVVYLNRQVPLSVEQDKAYKAMKEHLHIMQRGEPVTAVNAAVKIGKLLEICSGCVKATTGIYAPLDITPRIAALKEAIIEAHAKTIVFVPYTGALWQVAKELEKEFTVGVIDGSIVNNARTKVLNAFTKSAEPQILVANPVTASHGLNLSVADTMIWFSPIHSLDIYNQACERMARPGQKNNMRIIHLGATTLEWGVYKILKDKDIQQQSLLDLYRQEVGE